MRTDSSVKWSIFQETVDLTKLPSLNLSLRRLITNKKSPRTFVICSASKVKTCATIFYGKLIKESKSLAAVGSGLKKKERAEWPVKMFRSEE